MRQSKVIEDCEAGFKKKRPVLKIGDTVRIHTRIVEGDKERIQIFSGTIIAKKGSGISETFSVYRNAYGCSMERVFLLHSPFIGNIEVIRSGKVRRSKLYYLRGVSGKAAKVKEKRGLKLVEEGFEETPESPMEESSEQPPEISQENKTPSE